MTRQRFHCAVCILYTGFGGCCYASSLHRGFNALVLLRPLTVVIGGRRSLPRLALPVARDGLLSRAVEGLVMSEVTVGTHGMAFKCLAG